MFCNILISIVLFMYSSLLKLEHRIGIIAILSLTTRATSCSQFFEIFNTITVATILSPNCCIACSRVAQHERFSKFVDDLKNIASKKSCVWLRLNNKNIFIAFTRRIVPLAYYTATARTATAFEIAFSFVLLSRRFSSTEESVDVLDELDELSLSYEE